jgi:conjugative relaxase-like TrwC/TraI family protein
MTLAAGSVRDAVRHALEQSTSLEDAAERLAEFDLDLTKIPGLVDALDRGAGMTWTGAGAEAQGLSGAASGKDVAQLLTVGRIVDKDGVVHADIPARSGGGKGAFGIIRAEDKTVSALLAHPDPAVRQAGEDAHRAANAAFIATLEASLRSRTGKDGVTSTAITGIIAATVEHYSSSAGDPTKHSHILVSRMAQCSDGKWRAIDGNSLFGAMAAAESAAQAALAKSLSQSLDCPLGWHEVGASKMVEIPSLRDASAPLCNAKRRVDKVLDDMGRLFGPAWKETRDAWRHYRANAGQVAEQVEHAIDAALRTETGGQEVRALWHRRAPGLAHALDAIRPRQEPPPPVPAPDPAEVKAKAWAWACDQETVRWSDLTAKMTTDLGFQDAARAAVDLLSCAEAVRPVDSDTARAAVQAMLDKTDIDTSAMRTLTGRAARFTTAPAVDRAEALTASAKARMLDRGCRLAVEMPETATADQRSAIGLMAAGHQLCVVTGVAGAGKTFSVAPVAQAAHNVGLKVVSVARNAARAIETGEGIQADSSVSLAKFWKSGPPRGPALIVLDEGGVVDREDYNQLLKMLEDRPDIQVIALGDARQAQSIDRLDTWSLLEHAAKDSGSHAELTASRRTAKWTDEHDAIRACAAPEQLIDHILAEDRIHSVNANNYSETAARLLANDPSATAIVQTNAECAAISRLVQRDRGIKAVMPCMGNNRLGLGDVVRTRKNDHRAGVHNGDIWTVESISKNEVVLKSLHSNKRATVDPKYVSDSTELGYASTLDSAQGITVSRAIVVVGDGMGNTGLYSATTRGKNAPVYLCVTDPDNDPETAQNAAVERLRGAITTDDKAENALTYRNEKTVAEFVWQTPVAVAEREERLNNEFAAKRAVRIKANYNEATKEREQRWSMPVPPPPALAPSLTPDRRPSGGGRGGPGR